MTPTIQRDFARGAQAIIRVTGGCLWCCGKQTRCLACNGRAHQRLHATT